MDAICTVPSWSVKVVFSCPEPSTKSLALKVVAYSYLLLVFSARPSPVIVLEGGQREGWWKRRRGEGRGGGFELESGE
jgi:hypothetical protein